MRLTFLGTSAAELYPAAFCQCEYCNRARQLGGRNVRANAAAFLAPDCLIDLTRATAVQAHRFGVPLERIEHLFITHAHGDHFDLDLLWWSRYREEPSDSPGCRESPAPLLHLYAPPRVYAMLYQDGQGPDPDLHRTQVHPLEYGGRFQAGDMACVALEANHQDGDGRRAMNYIIQRGGRTLLYALDTSWFLDETLERISEYRYDLVVLDATYGLCSEHDTQHGDLALAKRALALFMERDLLREGACFCISHLSPHWTPVHDDLTALLEGTGITVAYDGLTVGV